MASLVGYMSRVLCSANRATNSPRCGVSAAFGDEECLARNYREIRAQRFNPKAGLRFGFTHVQSRIGARLRRGGSRPDGGFTVEAECHHIAQSSGHSSAIVARTLQQTRGQRPTAPRPIRREAAVATWLDDSPRSRSRGQERSLKFAMEIVKQQTASLRTACHPCVRSPSDHRRCISMHDSTSPGHCQQIRRDQNRGIFRIKYFVSSPPLFATRPMAANAIPRMRCRPASSI